LNGNETGGEKASPWAERIGRSSFNVLSLPDPDRFSCLLMMKALRLCHGFYSSSFAAFCCDRTIVRQLGTVLPVMVFALD